MTFIDKLLSVVIAVAIVLWCIGVTYPLFGA